MTMTDEADGSVSGDGGGGRRLHGRRPGVGGPWPLPDDDAPLPAIAVSAGDAVTEGGGRDLHGHGEPGPGLAAVGERDRGGRWRLTASPRARGPSASRPTGSATLTLATANDDADEPDGSVTSDGGRPARATRWATPASGSVSIADDDLPPAGGVDRGEGGLGDGGRRGRLHADGPTARRTPT